MARGQYQRHTPMTDTTLRTFLDHRYSAATNYRDTEVATRRKIVRDYYQGLPLGNEVLDRSQAIQFEVRAKVEGILPGLIEVFFGEEDVVTIEPDDEVYEDLLDDSGTLDEEKLGERVKNIAQAMRDATDHVNDVFLKRNEGFMIGYTAMKDALMEITGIIKVWVEEVERKSVETVEGIFEGEMDELLGKKDVELENVSDPYLMTTEAGIEVTAYDADIVTRKMKPKISIAVIPPEDFGIDDDAVASDRDSWRYMYHARLATRTELIEEGYDNDIVYSIPAYQGSAGTTGTTGVTVTRRRSNTDYDAILEPSQEEVRIVEHFLSVDYDGDGVGERRRVTVGGNAGAAGVTLDNDLWDDDWPFYVIQPIVKPHEFFGIAFAELVTNHQLIGSTILREWYDNVYGANNNRLKVFESEENQVDMAAVYAKRQDTPIRIRARPGMADVTPMPHVDLGQSILPLLEYQDRRSEVDSGVSRYAAGVSNDMLNQTAHGMERITSKSEERQALIARMFAETGFNAVFHAIYKLSRKYLGGPRPHASAGNVRVIDPSTWPELCSVTMSVGLGHGSPMERRANSQALVALLKEGAQFGYVSQMNGFNGLATAIRSLGFKSAVPYLTDPSSAAGKAEQEKLAKKREETSDMDKFLEIEKAKIEQKAAEAEAKMQAQIAKLQGELQEAQMRGQLEQAQFLAEQRQHAVENRLDMRKLVTDVALQVAELTLDAGEKLNLAHDADLAEVVGQTLEGTEHDGTNGSGEPA